MRSDLSLILLITSVNLEYEYCFTNGSFDVVAIVNVRKRKRLTEFNAREVEIRASVLILILRDI